MSITTHVSHGPARNPGIVPPWLQQPAAPAHEAGIPSRVQRTAGAAARDAASGEAVLRDGRESRPAGVSDAAAAHEQLRLEQTVAEIQDKFRAIGIKDSEGNDELVARFNPRYPNASYSPNPIPEYRVPADSITVGFDERDGTPFTRVPDVIAHELAHRVIHKMTPQQLSMSPFSEDVAIHESLADTFASVIDDDWVMGDQLSAPIRIMDRPERLGHPGHVDDLRGKLDPGGRYTVPIDQNPMTGRVRYAPDWHVVAGIPNKAASIIGDELGREKLGEIYLKATREHVRPGQKIEGLAAAVLLSTKDLYGADSREFRVAADAWDAVGVLDLLKQQR